MTRARDLARWLPVVILLALPAPAAAQVSPTAPAHPAFPWGIGVATPQGQLIRYLYVPPQVVTLDYLMTGALENAPPPEESAPPAEPKSDGKAPEGQSKGEPPAEAKPPEEPPRPTGPQIVRQQVMIPGYYVRETTAGYHYPERWTIEQFGPNAYRWRQIPPQFVPK